MAAAPAMQREAVGLALMAVLPIGRRLVMLLLRLWLPAPGDERWKAIRIALVFPDRLVLTRLLVARGIRLLIASVMRLLIPLLMMLMMLLLAFAGRILIVTRRIGLLLLGLAIAVIRFAAAHHGMTLILAFVVEGFIVRRVSFRAVELRLLLSLAELLLCCGDQAEIVFGVLIIILRRYRIARSLRVARELDVFFRDVGRRTADLHVRTVRFIYP